MTATYSGDSDYTSSNGALTQTVNQDASTTTLGVSSSSPVVGQSLTLTARVTAQSPGSGTPTGTVTFYDGTTVLGTGTLGSGSAKLVLSTGLSLGTHSLTVAYDGDTNFLASSSTAKSETVTQRRPGRH